MIHQTLHRNRNHQAGFGLIEVLVVVAIIGIITAALTSVVTSMHRQQTYSLARAGKSILIDDLHRIFSNGVLCTAAFQNKILGNIGDQTPIGLDLAGEPSISADEPTTLPDYGVIVSKLYMSQISAASTTPSRPVFFVTIAADMTEANALSSKAAPRALAEATVASVYIQVSNVKDRKIVSCFTTAGNDDGTMKMECPMLGGTWNSSLSKCDFSFKPCNLGDNQNVNWGLHQVVPGTSLGPWLPDSIIGGSLGLGTNPQTIQYAGYYYTTSTLSDDDYLKIAQIKAGKIPSGTYAMKGTKGVCDDGNWVDSGVVATEAGSPGDAGGDGGDDSGDGEGD